MNFNPNSIENKLEHIDIDNPKTFPKFIKGVSFKKFRHIENLDVNFNNPITVIAGSNKSGKSTILMAIACSHLEFNKKSFNTGKIERRTWSAYIRFTTHDIQNCDWEYSILYKTGSKVSARQGKRKNSSRKWSGVGKKESQIKDRDVILLDVDRIVPARTLVNTISRKNIGLEQIEQFSRISDLKDCISYIYEENYTIDNSIDYSDKKMFNLNTNGSYSSFNTASGEDVVLNMLVEILSVPNGSLILIDEIEIGLHPKVQRRFLDIIKHICITEEKQFIITSHSPTVYSSIPSESRVFIFNGPNGWKSQNGMNVNAIMSTMDSLYFPLIDLFCEDKEAQKIIEKALQNIMNNRNITNIKKYVNCIPIGSADKTYKTYIAHKETYEHKKIRSGYSCILDGDMTVKKDNEGNLLYPPESNLYFLFNNSSPEKYLVTKYLELNFNSNLKYHLENSNNHVLFSKMVDFGLATSTDNAFDLCYESLMQSQEGISYMEKLENFIIETCNKHSAEL